MKLIRKIIIVIFLLSLLSCIGDQADLQPAYIKETALAQVSTFVAETQIAQTPTFTIDGTHTAIPNPYDIIPPQPDQQVYTDPEGWYVINFPADWIPSEKPNSFFGEEGSFEAGYLPELGYMSYSVNVCVWLANIEFDPRNSGVMLDFNNQIWGCKAIINTGGTLVEQTIYENPGVSPLYRFAYLKTTTNLHFARGAPVSFSWLRQPIAGGGTITLPPLSVTEKSFWENTSPIPSNISITEYALPIAQPKEESGLFQFIPTEAWPVIKPKDDSPIKKLTINDLGYELREPTNEGLPGSQLYRDNRILFDHVFKVSDVYSYKTETGLINVFIVQVIDTNSRGHYMKSFIIQNDAINQWDYNNNDPSFAPVLYQGELLWVKAAENAHVQIHKSNQEIIFDFATYFGIRLPINNFRSWDNHWILEIGDFVIQDGEILNEKFGFQEVFEWSLVKDKPTYFFRKGSRIGISHDGNILPTDYQDVAHGLCCGPAQNNPFMGENSIHFFGKRDGTWYYVVMKFE